jgi:hypothetical protein
MFLRRGGRLPVLHRLIVEVTLENVDSRPKAALDLLFARSLRVTAGDALRREETLDAVALGRWLWAYTECRCLLRSEARQTSELSIQDPPCTTRNLPPEGPSGSTEDSPLTGKGNGAALRRECSRPSSILLAAAVFGRSGVLSVLRDWLPDTLDSFASVTS